jgi:tRNA C32,U32 (ribose-2'-O)-methylase TrmJ
VSTVYSSLLCVICVLRNEQVLRAEEAKYAQESGDDVHQHRQALKDLDAKLQSTEVSYCTTAISCCISSCLRNAVHLCLHSIRTLRQQ